MSFREFVENDEDMIKIDKPVSKKLTISGIIHEAGEKSVLLSKVKESEFRVAGNVFASKERAGKYLGCKTEELIPKIINAIENPSKPEEVSDAPCFEIEENDLEKLPILFHTEIDGGNYITSGVVIVKDKELGQNVAFHRGMPFQKDKLAVRILQRHTMKLLEKNNGELPAVYCIGCGAEVLLSAAISTPTVVNELEIANTLKPIRVVKAKTCDVMIPADSEFVIEGTLSLNERHEEGPFLDLTETKDIIRREPVFTVKKIYHRKDAIWHGLNPGGYEHKVLMGMPREPTIFREVNRVVKCLDVNINPGGCSWLHAIVKIDKKNEDDGRKAIEAAFKGHSSCKHVFVVDKDIDIYNPNEVEWAMATRFQANRDMVVKEGERGSSLDPSSDLETRKTTKVGFDFTMPLDRVDKMKKVKYHKLKLDDFK